MIRGAGALALAALLPALAGCFLFGGGDEKEEKKHDESLMDASTGADSGTAPAPGVTPEIEPDRGPSQLLPTVSLAMSVITLITLLVHMGRGRRRHHAHHET